MATCLPSRGTCKTHITVYVDRSRKWTNNVFVRKNGMVIRPPETPRKPFLFFFRTDRENDCALAGHYVWVRFRIPRFLCDNVQTIESPRSIGRTLATPCSVRSRAVVRSLSCIHTLPCTSVVPVNSLRRNTIKTGPLLGYAIHDGFEKPNRVPPVRVLPSHRFSKTKLLGSTHFLFAYARPNFDCVYDRRRWMISIFYSFRRRHGKSRVNDMHFFGGLIKNPIDSRRRSYNIYMNAYV